MKKKKFIIASFFLTLIALTTIYTVVSAVKSYNYDMDPANGVDILEGFGAAMLIVLGGFVVFYELDLFYTVYYFFVIPRTITKSTLNILSNVSLLLVFVSEYIANALSISEETNVTIALFFIYLVLRSVYALVYISSLNQED